MWVLGAGIMLGGLLGAAFAGVVPGLALMVVGAGLAYALSAQAES